MACNLPISEIYRAAQALRDVARHPRLIGVTNLSDSAQVYLKPENLQYTGSFKLRGAYYKISQLSDQEKARGVIACSAGNHAQGVALGATHNGIKSVICLPAGAPLSKVEATKKLGAEVVLVPGVYDDAYQRALELQKEKGYTLVHPFDDPKVIAGQGTIGLEILDEMPNVEAVIVPIGGGGLISGVAMAIKELRPEVKVYGVQSAGAPSMEESVKGGHIKRLEQVSTIADGIAVKEPGVNTFDLVNRYVDDIVTVTDDETAAAILTLIERQKLIAEGAGAVSVAAAMFNKLPIEGKRVVSLVSGGNIDVNFLNRIISRGLAKTGRAVTLTIDLDDKPGQLSGVCGVVGELGGNIISVVHDRIDPVAHVNGCSLRIELETRNAEHIQEIKDGLTQKGYRVR
ncbi:MAG: threonine ammonia-lyase [Bacteroidales bacterium]|nr:threonine ammonia-lyase [Bacteroidales bacterium]MCD8394702.1 threonine ammonia-lyase [Bacteroidales bacterium]